MSFAGQNVFNSIYVRTYVDEVLQDLCLAAWLRSSSEFILTNMAADTCICVFAIAFRWTEFARLCILYLELCLHQVLRPCCSQWQWGGAIPSEPGRIVGKLVSMRPP